MKNTFLLSAVAVTTTVLMASFPAFQSAQAQNRFQQAASQRLERATLARELAELVGQDNVRVIAAQAEGFASKVAYGMTRDAILMIPESSRRALRQERRSLDNARIRLEESRSQGANGSSNSGLVTVIEREVARRSREIQALAHALDATDRFLSTATEMDILGEPGFVGQPIEDFLASIHRISPSLFAWAVAPSNLIRARFAENLRSGLDVALALRAAWESEYGNGTGDTGRSATRTIRASDLYLQFLAERNPEAKRLLARINDLGPRVVQLDRLAGRLTMTCQEIFR